MIQTVSSNKELAVFNFKGVRNNLNFPDLIPRGWHY